MKKFLFLFMTFSTLTFFTSCDKDTNEENSTDILIEEISNASAKQEITPEDLPASTKAFIEDEHFETYIESVSFVDGKGYEVTLATEDVEYFDREGIALRSSANPHGCHRPGPCGGGQRILIENLPFDVTGYIAENYPDEEIRRAKVKGQFTLVAITGPTILIFDENNDFVNEAPLIRFCFGERINPDNLRVEITDYIAENCPDGEIAIAFRVRNKIAVGIMTPDGRKIMVFNLAGEFLFERP